MSELVRSLSLYDVIFSGYGYTVGADIFALIPYIARTGKHFTWVAFLIGGIIVLATALSYARLNLEYPSNDAEYTWIRESFKVPEEEVKDDADRRRNRIVDIFATIVIWAVMVMGVTMNSVMVVSINRFLKRFNINIPDIVLNFLIVLAPFAFNLLDAKNLSNSNIVVTILTAIILIMIPAFAFKKAPHLSDVSVDKLDFNKDSMINLIRAIGITILPYNGYQSVVQMSEEVKDTDDVPKGMMISGGLTIFAYCTLAIAVIAILGLTKTGKSTSPLADIFKMFLGDKGGAVANIVGILTGFTTLLLSFYSRSRLLSKISEYGIAPSIFSKLGVDTGNSKLLSGVPFFSLVVIGIFTYISTVIKEDALEVLTDITNVLTCFIFVCVNLGVLINYYKKDNKVNKPDSEKTLMDRLREMPPYYAVLGLIIFSILLYSGIKHFGHH
jgi:amino acid transporter